jgi:hypothetical protein
MPGAAIKDPNFCRTHPQQFVIKYLCRGDEHAAAGRHLKSHTMTPSYWGKYCRIFASNCRGL